MMIKTAVIGGGIVSDVHLTGISRNPRTELVGVCDIDEPAARAKASAYGTTPFFDLDEMLDAVDLDWIHLCTPVQTHLPLGTRIIEAGVPLLIEKPVTESSEEFAELRVAAERHDVPVSVVHQHVFDPAMRKARALLRSNRLGEVRGVDLLYGGETTPDMPNRGSWTFELPGGEFEEGLPHPIYLVLATGGYPERADDVQAVTTLRGDYEGEFTYDCAQVQYVSDTDVLCTITALTDTTYQRILRIHGEAMSVDVDLFSQTVVTVGDYSVDSTVSKIRNNVDRSADRLAGIVENGRLVARSRFGGSWDELIQVNPHFYQFDAEAEALANGTAPAIPLDQAAWTVRIMESIRRAAGRDRPSKRISATLADDGQVQ